MNTTTLYRCSRCDEPHPWEELDPGSGRFDLLCCECWVEVRAETQVEGGET